MKNTPIIVGIILVILIGAGVYAITSNNTATSTPSDTLTATDTTQMPMGSSTNSNNNSGNTGGAAGTAGSTSGTVGAGATVTNSNNVAVAIKNFAFTPPSLQVKAGTKVTWTNNDTAPHTVTSVTGGTLNSPQLATGESYSFTFTKAGTYSYYCSVHPNMKGTVVVTQ